MSIKRGWVQITDNLSEFHRALINTIPKYASIAVAEMQLPADMDELLPDERQAMKPVMFNSRAVASGMGAARLLDSLMRQAHASKLDFTLMRRPVKPDYSYKQPLSPQFDHKLVHRYTGKKGEIKSIELSLFNSDDGLVAFRGEDFHTVDSLGGSGTRICNVFVGSRPQRHIVPTWFGEFQPETSAEVTHRLNLARREHGKLVPMDTIDAASRITVQVMFVEECEFAVRIDGKAVR